MTASANSERRAYRKAEVAAMYNVSPKTVQSWVDRKLVRPLAHTRIVLIPKSELERMEKETLR